MSRRTLNFPVSQEVAVSKQAEGTQVVRNQQITNFFKPVCIPGKDALKNIIGNKRLKPQTQDEDFESNKYQPCKRQKKSSTESSNVVNQASVRNLHAFCAKCGMSVLSPKVVIERLTLPSSTLIHCKEGFKNGSNSSEVQSLSSIKSRAQSRNVRSMSFSGKFDYNQQFFDERSQTVSGENDHSPQKPFILVDSWASHKRSHGGITKKKATHQVVILGKSKEHKFLSEVRGASVNGKATSNVTNTSESSEESGNDSESEFSPSHTRPFLSEYKNLPCSTPDTSVKGLKVLKRIRRDSLDSNESFHNLSLSADEEEEESLKPLNEIFQSVPQSEPVTPQKQDLSLLSLSQSSVPDTPVNDRLKQLLRTPCYDNNLERLVKEKEESERIDAIEKQLCEDLERGHGVADKREVDGEQDGELTDEHRDLLKKFSIRTNAIPDHHPGEEIFHLSKSGSIFNICTLNLQHLRCETGISKEMILSCSPGNQLMLATEGFLTSIYQFKKCPEELMRWMFQMLSVHPSYATSMKLLNALIEITCNHLTNIDEKPWIPTLLDIATVFANMGIEFKTLFPLLHIQPSFSELHLVSAVPESVSAGQETRCKEQIFSCIPEFQVAHVVKFLNFCTAVYRESFLDLEILALLVMLLKIHLEKGMKSIPIMDLHCLIANLLQNIKNWVTIMPELCFAMSQLSSHHHNFLKLLQLVPTFEIRGRELRRHVSLIFISNIQNGDCTAIPLEYESRMLLLAKCLSQMKPSSLVKKMQLLPENESKTFQDLDQEAYYLTFSLLHLVSDASTSDEPPSIQRKYLYKLSTELEKHIKSDIREDARFFYRTKVKDLVARIHGRWQELLLYSRPSQGKLHEYWEPVCESSSPPSSQESVEESFQENIQSNNE